MSDRVASAGIRPWYLYMIRCRQGQIYTGVTTDVERRLQEHSGGPRGARFLRGRGPLTLAYQSRVGDRHEALRAEHRVKQLSRVQKEALIQGRLDLRTLLE